MESTELQQTIQRIKAGIRQALANVIERDAVAQLILLGAIAQEHLIIIGPPGTAKSYVVKRVSSVMGGSYFEYLLGKFTEPSELFGTIDFAKLKEGRFETQTKGMLPEANFVFLDEIFLASTAILNTLLSILNERKFRRGHTQLPCPLKICVGASNHLPEDETLNAFSDRFLLTYFIEPIADPQLEALLTSGWNLAKAPSPFDALPNSSAQAEASDQQNLLNDIDSVSNQLKQVDINPIIPSLADTIRTLRKKDILLSDRRLTKLTKLIAASALLEGRLVASQQDLWPIIYAIQNEEHQRVACEALQNHIGSAQHDLFGEAIYEAMGSLTSLESVLINSSEELLFNYHNRTDSQDSNDLKPKNQDFSKQGNDKWKVKAEELLRQIDAGFASAGLSEKLNQLRQQLIEIAKPQVND